nr:MAG TPA: hypothetical protein [Caudoviricetes sp.]
MIQSRFRPAFSFSIILPSQKLSVSLQCLIIPRSEINRPQSVGGFFMSITQHMINAYGVYPRLVA